MIRCSFVALPAVLAVARLVRWAVVRFVITDTSSEVPTAPATCLTVLEMAVPWAFSLAGNWFNPAVCTGMRIIAIPIRRPVDMRTR
ncbi:hypothetical protein D3C73_1498820 [compost metagenome]